MTQDNRKYPSQTQLYLTREQKARLMAEAEERGMSFSGFVRWVLDKFMRDLDNNQKGGTMISDTLFDTIQKIINFKGYQRDFPGACDSIKDKIYAVVEHMEELRIFLDAPPVLKTEKLKRETFCLRAHQKNSKQ